YGQILFIKRALPCAFYHAIYNNSGCKKAVIGSDTVYIFRINDYSTVFITQDIFIKAGQKKYKPFRVAFQLRDVLRHPECFTFKGFAGKLAFYHFKTCFAICQAKSAPPCEIMNS